jgi:glyoxylase-like metal-dependent hydrolase (beta-lactamase superfamily II)
MQIGQAELTPVIEIEAGPVPAFALCDGWDQMLLEPHADWLYPKHIDPASGNALLSHHSWLLRIGDTTVLIDPCIGNDKPRNHPAIAYYDRLDTPWLDRLAAAGARPEDIDIVVCTHLHPDHCGWNTRLVDGRWVPTFPNARYVVSATEVAFWEEFTAHPDRYPQYGFNLGVFTDSMTPVIEAGLATMVNDGDEPTPGLTMMATPGHTAGHCALLYADDVDGICFAGDVFHTPVNVLFPQWSMLPGGNHDSAVAATSRLAVLDHCVDTGHLLAPAHFQAPHCCRVGRGPDGSYTISW